MIRISEHIKSILSSLPQTPGVYQYFDKDGVIIYVGKAVNLKRRVSSYFQKEHEWLKTRQLVRHIADIKYIVVNSEQDAFLLENNLIKQYQPHYNILLKDGKSYPSICITREPFPRVFKTRKIIHSIGDYYGPYSFGNTVDLVLDLIHQLYPLRTCAQPITMQSVSSGKYKVCLKYHLHRCCGVCAGCVSQEEYREYIDAARKIIRGDAREIRVDLEQKMMVAAAQMKYELADELKEKLDMLDKFCSKTVISNTHIGQMDVFGYDEQDQNVYISMLHIQNGSIVSGQTIEYKKQLDEPREEILALGMMELRERLHSITPEVIVPFIPDGFDEKLHINLAISGDKKKLLQLAMQNVLQYKKDRLRQADKLNPDQRAMRVLTSLQQVLNLPKTPLFIDSFDNSSIQGEQAVAACVVFKHAKPSKKDYKRFKIKTVVGPDDYASMREIVHRRYQDIIDEQGTLPDLIIADGGIGQVHAIREVIEKQLQLSIPVVGLKKDDKHRTNTLIFGDPVQEVSLPVTDEVFRLLVQIQDEVHRFAISYHKKVRSKSQIHSQLDDIQGVGAATKQKLLQHFHSVARIRTATLPELQSVVPTHYASIVYDYFNTHLSL
ncbi:MAG: excinuclease ABC subunit UvrC [Paludibacteraceae bacterium]|nr:excinuclease ABC subunit UvrC [Paludibacteraceae bacterium]